MSVKISLWRKIGKLEPNLLHQPFEKKAMNITAADWSQVSTLVSEATEWNFENQTPARLFTNRPWFTCVAQLVALVLMANPARSTSFYACFSAGAWKRKVIRILSIMFSQMVRIQSFLDLSDGSTKWFLKNPDKEKSKTWDLLISHFPT